MVVVVAQVQQQFRRNREPAERPEPEDRTEVAELVEPRLVVDEEVPVVFQRHPFVDFAVAPRLQPVGQAEPDEMLFRDPVDLVEVVQIVRVHGRSRQIRVVDVRHDHVTQSVEAPVRVLHVLPGVVELRVHLHADFPDHAELRSALGVVVRDIVSPRDALGLVGDEHRGEFAHAHFPLGRLRVCRQADPGARDDVDVPQLHRVVEHVQGVEPERPVVPHVPVLVARDVAVESAPPHEERRERHLALIVDVRQEFLTVEIHPQFGQAVDHGVEIVDPERQVGARGEPVALILQRSVGRRLVFGVEPGAVVVAQILVVADEVDLHPEVQTVREMRHVVRAHLVAVMRHLEARIVQHVVRVGRQEVAVPVFVLVPVVDAVEEEFRGGFRGQQVGSEAVSQAALLVPVEHHVHVPVRLVRDLEVLRAADVPAPVAAAAELDLAAEAVQVGRLVQDRQPQHRHAVDLEEIVLHEDAVIPELAVVVEDAAVVVARLDRRVDGRDRVVVVVVLNVFARREPRLVDLHRAVEETLGALAHAVEETGFEREIRELEHPVHQVAGGAFRTDHRRFHHDFHLGELFAEIGHHVALQGDPRTGILTERLVGLQRQRLNGFRQHAERHVSGRFDVIRLRIQVHHHLVRADLHPGRLDDRVPARHQVVTHEFVGIRRGVEPVRQLRQLGEIRELHEIIRRRHPARDVGLAERLRRGQQQGRQTGDECPK